MLFFHPFTCSRCGWVLGNIQADGTFLHCGLLVIVHEMHIQCVNCSAEQHWFPVSKQKRTRKSRSVADVPR